MAKLDGEIQCCECRHRVTFQSNDHLDRFVRSAKWSTTDRNNWLCPFCRDVLAAGHIPNIIAAERDTPPTHPNARRIFYSKKAS